MNIISLFSGIGAPERALENIKVKTNVVHFSEIKVPTIKAYSMLHSVNENLNLGNIATLDMNSMKHLSGSVDLLTWGFPCQDFSIGNTKGKGLNGARSGLYYYGLEVLKAVKPKYSVIENVDNLVNKDSGVHFKNILKDLDETGYRNYYKVLNAMDFGIPQNRRRLFIVSIRKDLNQEFVFPQGQMNCPNWWDFIDPYDTREMTNRQKRMINFVRGIGEEKINIEGIPQFDCAVIHMRQSGLRFQNNREHPTVLASYGEGGGNFSILAYKQHVGAIKPRQCFKLMGFNYEDCDLLEKAGLSCSSLYVMAGNSIVVNVLEDIFKSLIIND